MLELTLEEFRETVNQTAEKPIDWIAWKSAVFNGMVLLRGQRVHIVPKIKQLDLGI